MITRIDLFKNDNYKVTKNILEKGESIYELLRKYKIDSNDQRIWFSQLYGMSDNISFTLANSGYNVAKYLPFGPVHEVMPYLMRRLDENSSISSQTNRELQLIKKELKRRKN